MATTAIQQEQIPVYAGSELLRFSVSDMPPSLRVYSYVNGVNVSDFTGPTTSGAQLGDAITTDQLGAASGYLYIPSTQGKYKFLTGEIRLTFGDSPDGIDKCKYLSETILMNHGLNLVDTEHGGTISLRSTEKFRTDATGTSGEADTSQKRLDPLSQTFTIDSTRYPLGVYLTSISLFIKTKDEKLPIAVELRPMSSGKPSTTEYYSGSFAIKNPADVKVYDETAQTVLPTTFYFDHLIYLRPGEYAFCVLTKSDKYEVFSAKNGDGKTVKQPFSGRLFKPQNTGEWVGDENEDLAFVLGKAKFETGTVSFEMKTQSVRGAEYHKLRLLSTEINFGDSASVEYKVQTTIAGTNEKTDYTNIVPGVINNLGERNTVSAEGDITFQVSMTTKNPDISPMLDKQLLAAQIIANNVLPYSQEISNSELKSSNGSARTRYISKIVTLQKDFDSNGIEVKVDVNRKLGTDIEVFARVLSRNDNSSQSGIGARPWVLLPLVSPTEKSYAGTSSAYTQEVYRITEQGRGLIPYTVSSTINGVATDSTFDSFAYYQVKIVFYSNNPTYLPKIKNLIATSLL